MLENKSAFDYCPTEECKEIIASTIWKRLYKRDIDTAEKYVNKPFPKEIWELILLNKRQMQLCKNLQSNKNKEILFLFALELNIPVSKEMTKPQLCGIIARQLAFGKYYTEQSKKYGEEKIRQDISSIRSIAGRFGLDMNRPIDEILKDLAALMK